MEINGLPLHVLVVHASVVLVPLAALSAILFAVPRWRWLLRWPSLLLSLAALVLVQVSMVSGRDLRKVRKLYTPQVQIHAELAEKLRVGVLVLALVAVLAFWSLGFVTRLAGGADRRAKVAALELPLTILLPIAGVAVLILAFLTGEAGARAVWG